MPAVQSITDFYNSIASEYNGHMTNADRKVRAAVHYIVAKTMASGNILDFGGGTGLDIPWFLDNHYHITFVEPSDRMRSIAHVNHVSKDEVMFVENNTDFNNWTASNLPFQHKVDGILANFAVLNCIKDLDVLFEKFALISSDSARIIATMIDPGFQNIMRNYSLFTAIRAQLLPRLTIYNKYRDQFHATYIHSLTSIKKASSRYFELESVTPLDSSSFAVFIFKKK